MSGVQDYLEIKFRLTDGSDIGPKSYSAATSVATLKKLVLAQWPKAKKNGPRAVKDVKIISAGKILENNVTLGECRSPICDIPGGVTTMHVVVQLPSVRDLHGIHLDVAFVNVLDAKKFRTKCEDYSEGSDFHCRQNVRITVKGVTSIAETDDNFVCVTLDWWPTGKCNYNQCPWGASGILDLDLNNTILQNAVKAFNPLRVRVEGSLQDQVLYNLGNAVKLCDKFQNSTTGLFGFTQACLTMERWDELNNFLNQSGALVTFGLNALYGRKRASNDGLFVGNWNWINALDLMVYTVSKGYKIDSYELENELSGGEVSARVEAAQYGKDLVILRRLIDKVYQNYTRKPMLLAPGGFYDKKWFSTFLQVSGPNIVDAVSHHIYNLGGGADPDLINKIQNPLYLEQVAQRYKDVSATVKSFAPWASVWVGESGGAFKSGAKDISNTFVDGFWYLDQLGMTSSFNHKVFCRQTLIGGNYGLLNTTTFVPNPDYYGALLWHRLMGKNVLSTTHQGSPNLRAYSHCSKSKPGITLMLINMAYSTSFNVSVVNDLNLYPESAQGVQQREEYHLTPQDDNIQSDVVLLNGKPLVLTESLDIPTLNPALADSSSPITVAPHSIVFATLKDSTPLPVLKITIQPGGVKVLGLQRK